MSLLSPPLQAFLAITRRGTVHGAARDLRLTQTGVTQRIRGLERELGTTLFLRSRKGMKLTGEGEALLRYCEQSEELEGRVFSQIQKRGITDSIRVSLLGPTSIVSARVVDQCIPLYARWPSLFLSFVVGDAPDRVAQVKSGAATFAIVPPSHVPAEMDSKLLRPDRYVLVGTPRWRGRRLVDILETERIIDFDEHDPTTLDYLRTFQLAEKLGRPRLYINNNPALIKLFCAGVGFGTLTREVAKPHLEAGELITLNGGAVFEEPHALIWYPRSQKPPYFRAIIDAIK